MAVILILSLFSAPVQLAMGVATYYANSHEGNPLYCDQFVEDTLTYDLDATPWVAFPVEWYETGKITCGEWVLLDFGDRWLLARAYDAGGFGGFSITVGTVQGPIVVDVPEFLAAFMPDMSAHVKVWKLSP